MARGMSRWHFVRGDARCLVASVVLGVCVANPIDQLPSVCSAVQRACATRGAPPEEPESSVLLQAQPTEVRAAPVEPGIKSARHMNFSTASVLTDVAEHQARAHMPKAAIAIPERDARTHVTEAAISNRTRRSPVLLETVSILTKSESRVALQNGLVIFAMLGFLVVAGASCMYISADYEEQKLRHIGDFHAQAGSAAHSSSRGLVSKPPLSKSAGSQWFTVGAGLYRRSSSSSITTGCSSVFCKSKPNAVLAKVMVPRLNVAGSLGLVLRDDLVVMSTSAEASQAGWQDGDKILSVNGAPVSGKAQFLAELSQARELHKKTSMPLIFDVEKTSSLDDSTMGGTTRSSSPDKRTPRPTIASSAPTLGARNPLDEPPSPTGRSLFCGPVIKNASQLHVPVKGG